MPSKSQFSLFFAVRTETKKNMFHAALLKFDTKLELARNLLIAWEKGSDPKDIRYESFLAPLDSVESQRSGFVTLSQEHPKRATSAVISMYRENINPIITAIKAEQAKPLNKGSIAVLEILNAPSSFIVNYKADIVPKWIAETIRGSFTLTITGPKKILEDDTVYEQLIIKSRKAIDPIREKASDIIEKAERDIEGVFSKSALDWENPFKVTKQELDDNRAIAEKNIIQVRTIIEQTNAALSSIPQEAFDAGREAALAYIALCAAQNKELAKYKFGFKKRVVKAVVGLVGGSVALAATVATAGGTIFFGVYTVVNASAALIAIFVENCIGLERSYRQLKDVIDICETQRRAGNVKLNKFAEGLEKFASMMKIPADIYGELVQSVSNAEKHLGMFQKNLALAKRSYHNLRVHLEKVFTQQEAIPFEGLTAEQEQKMGELTTWVVEQIRIIEDNRNQIMDYDDFSLRAINSIALYTDFVRGPVQNRYETAEDLLGYVSDIKNVENMVCAGVHGLDNFTTYVNIVPTDIVDVLASLAG